MAVKKWLDTFPLACHNFHIIFLIPELSKTNKQQWLLEKENEKLVLSCLLNILLQQRLNCYKLNEKKEHVDIDKRTCKDSLFRRKEVVEKI